MITGGTFHAIFSEDKKSDSVLLHIKNKSMELEGCTERHILGMIHRGLCVSTEKDEASGSFLVMSLPFGKEISRFVISESSF